MEIKILQVFYDKNGLPYKDKERTVHYPITSGTFLGSSNTTQIRFYYDRLDELNESTFVAISKLPNGRIGSEILESEYDSELEENYAVLNLSQFYTQYKGDVYISLQGYEGGVRVEQDENGIYSILGTPTIQATGSIRMNVAYAPTFIGSGQTENITLQRVLAELSTKLGIRQETLHVEELPTVGNPNVWYVVNDDPNDTTKANIYIWNATRQTYVWVGDNTLDLGDYYTTEQGQEFEQEIDQRVASVENELESVAQGSPAGTFNNVDALTEAYPTGNNKIYVCLDDGKWYYWNTTNEEWTAGGTYLSSSLAEDVNVLKNNVNNINNYLERKSVNFGTEQNYSSYTSHASLGNVRFSAVRLTKIGLLQSITIKANAERTATIYIGKIVDGLYSYVTSFQMVIKNGLNTYINGIDFNYQQDLPVGAIIGIIGNFSIYYLENVDEKSYVITETNAVTSNTAQYAQMDYGVSISATVIDNSGLKEKVNFLLDYKNQSVLKRFSLSSNSSSYFSPVPILAIKKNLMFSFIGQITTFNELTFGLCNLSHNTNYNSVRITSTKVYLSNQFYTDFISYDHGLTISNNISISIKTNYNLTAHIKIMSNGYIWEQDISWEAITNRIMPFLQTDASTSLTNCSMSFTCGDYSKPIYAYGDSYFNYNQTRWTYYLSQDGYEKNLLLNGYGGMASNGAITTIKDDLEHGKPRYVLWCMGMNDSSDTDAPAENWKTYVDEVIELCKQYNCELIFATIPTIPTKNHEQKNAWIRSSGYRYIDFAKAVGAQSDGTWFSGMLETGHSPNEHPTETGAKALYLQALTDFPELIIGEKD